jgi:hypothetical protein
VEIFEDEIEFRTSFILPVKRLAGSSPGQSLGGDTAPPHPILVARNCRFGHFILLIGSLPHTNFKQQLV